ncbi:hypothetical protein Patl1_27532 [Pistacia atlantica]|uniref:Uncharacterized protein n=1 Tax=Pistacia atlantica TaxID=434234 RepID=A0ACC1BBK5_9ROSI|nr:hypothetical protein Patl1_27532 [Pistacia atlantica]
MNVDKANIAIDFVGYSRSGLDATTSQLFIVSYVFITAQFYIHSFFWYPVYLLPPSCTVTGTSFLKRNRKAGGAPSNARIFQFPSDSFRIQGVKRSSFLG